MGSTLEAQKAKAPKPKSKSKSKVIKVSPGKPYYSSPSLGKRFNQRMSTAKFQAAKLKANDAGAAVQPTWGDSLIDIFQDEEGKRGSRLARKAATEIIKRNEGGIARKTRIF